MDSVTQLVLGSAVAEATIGRQVGRRALLWGAVAGTLPDLDVLVPLGDAVSDFTYHRSASHSLFVLALATPLLAWLITHLHPSTRAHFKRWMLAIFLVFATHVLLDSFTAYGTQIFWPFVTTPMTWSTIFIIDPLYTLPLLVGIVAALVLSRASDRGYRINRIGLVLSSAYLAWTVVAKFYVDTRIDDALRDQGIVHERVFTTPAPFNSLLWRAVVRGRGEYYEGYYSIFDDSREIRFTRYASDDDLLESLAGHEPVNRLVWFSKGFYSVLRDDDRIVISDLRMGLEPNYVFRFKVADSGNPHPRPSAPELLPPVRSWELLPLVWERIWDSSVELKPSA